MTKSYKMLVFQAILNEDQFPGQLKVNPTSARTGDFGTRGIAHFAYENGAFRTTIPIAEPDPSAPNEPTCEIYRSV